MSQKYLRTYDNTKWVIERHHEVEVQQGCYYGALTLHKVNDPTRKWTLIDSVWFKHKEQGKIVPIPSPSLCGCGFLHDFTQRCGSGLIPHKVKDKQNGKD